MKQLRNFGDDRQLSFCAFCGADAATRDHVPPRVFLDTPYPANLPVVPACHDCNLGLSADEEYLACLIECVLAGSVSGLEAGRRKIRRILKKKPALAAMLEAARIQTSEGYRFSLDQRRVARVLTKLGRGHALFELNEPQHSEPSRLAYAPLPTLTGAAASGFERSVDFATWPEVGSRAMQRLVQGDDLRLGWVIVQPGTYRYATWVGEAVVVRVVLREYLACEVAWDCT